MKWSGEGAGGGIEPVAMRLQCYGLEDECLWPNVEDRDRREQDVT